MSTILVSDINIVAVLMCEVPPKRRWHLTHRTASHCHCSQLLFGWRMSMLFCWQGCLLQDRPYDNITLSSLLAVVFALAPSTINTMMTTTATIAGTTTIMTDSTASSCSHGCTLVSWAAAAAAAESMLRRQRQLGMRDSNGNGNGNGAVAAGQRQWWQQWYSVMEKRSSGCVLTELGSTLADSGSTLADSGSTLADLGCALVTWAAPS
jgi:hypothetical protein